MLNFDLEVIRTPTLRLRGTNNIFLKPENFQPFGSYKIRGVENVIKHMPSEALKNGLVTISAGNMAQAVAYAAKTIAIPADIFIPDSAPQTKKDAIQAIGGTIIEKPFAEIWDMVRNCTNPSPEKILIHPTETPLQVEGYGHIAEELLADLPDLEAIVIPFGVGGLSIGIVSALQKFKPSVDVFLAEPKTAAPMEASLRARRPEKIHRTPSFIDAIGTPEVLPSVFDRLAPFVQESLVVDVSEAKLAILDLLQKQALLIEGAAACALVAARKIESRYKCIACVLSGGNLNLSELGLSRPSPSYTSQA